MVGVHEAGEGLHDGLVDEVYGLVDEAGQRRGRGSRLQAPGDSLGGGPVLRGPVTAVNVHQVLSLPVIKLKNMCFFKSGDMTHATN